MPSPSDQPPDPVLPLLWRHVAPRSSDGSRRGRKQSLSVDDVINAAIELADRDGLAALSMRPLAQHLGLGAMSLYTYVPRRDDLVILMVDQVLGRRELPPMPDELPDRLELVARVQYDDYRTHPWLLDVSGVRPWLGPHAADRYEWQLSAVEGIGLTDLEMDQTVALLTGFATSIVRAEHEITQAERASGLTELEWWEANEAELDRLMAGRSYPVAGRVGIAAGEAYQASSDPARQLEFGLARIIDGLLAYLERDGG